MLLLTMSQLIPDVFNQANTFMGGVFDIYVCYGDEKRTKDTDMKARILSKAASRGNARACLGRLPRQGGPRTVHEGRPGRREHRYILPGHIQ